MITSNTQGLLSNDFVTLDGRGAHGRFGFSLTNMGDIDDDGMEDFAVGAPYTDSVLNSTRSYGSVFIFYGRGNLSAIEATRAEVRQHCMQASKQLTRFSSLSPSLLLLHVLLLLSLSLASSLLSPPPGESFRHCQPGFWAQSSANIWLLSFKWSGCGQ